MQIFSKEPHYHIFNLTFSFLVLSQLQLSVLCITLPPKIIRPALVWQSLFLADKCDDTACNTSEMRHIMLHRQTPLSLIIFIAASFSKSTLHS